MDTKDNVLRIYKKVLLLDDVEFLCLRDLLVECDNSYVLNFISLASSKRISLKNEINSDFYL